MKESPKLSWPCLRSYEGAGPGEIEPGESEEFAFDFILPATVETILVYAYVGNTLKDNLGWGLTTLY